jgi:hypothetical protein
MSAAQAPAPSTIGRLPRCGICTSAALRISSAPVTRLLSSALTRAAPLVPPLGPNAQQVKLGGGEDGGRSECRGEGCHVRHDRRPDSFRPSYDGEGQVGAVHDELIGGPYACATRKPTGTGLRALLEGFGPGRNADALGREDS